jgi:TatD DNase family protein
MIGRMRLFDAHCHLQDRRLLADIESVLGRAREAGVSAMACCGTAENNWEEVERLAAQFPGILPCFGIHPWYMAGRSTRWQEVLAGYAQDPRAAIGEIGLDHALRDVDREEQRQVFLDQMRLAARLDRPANVHCRRAWGLLAETLRDLGGFRPGLVVHSYSGAEEMLPELAALGAYFSFSGSVTHDRNIRGRRALASVPLDRLLIETDAPDLMPAIPGVEPTPDAVNEPAHLIHVLRCVAGLRGLTPERLAETTWENACRLYRWAPPAQA